MGQHRKWDTLFTRNWISMRSKGTSIEVHPTILQNSARSKSGWSAMVPIVKAMLDPV